MDIVPLDPEVITPPTPPPTPPPPTCPLFTDATLVADDGATRPAHRGVLAAHSRLFHSMLTSDMSITSIPLKGKCEADLEMLINYMYPAHDGWKGFQVSTVMRLVEIAREYDMTALLNDAEKWLVENVDIFCTPESVTSYSSTSPGEEENTRVSRYALKTLAFAHEYCLNVLYGKCLDKFKYLQFSTLRTVLDFGDGKDILNGSVMYDLVMMVR